MKVDKRFTTPGKRPGDRPIVKYAGLLDTATSNGLRSITTKLIHLDLERQVAIVHAAVTIEVDGVVKLYEAIGDASPATAGQVAKERWIAMADTRAKSRALRDAVNVGDCTIEDDLDPEDDDDAGHPAASNGPTPLRAPAETRSDDPEVAALQERFARTRFDAEAVGIRPPVAPATAVGLQNAIAGLEAQIARQRSQQSGERRAAGGRR